MTDTPFETVTENPSRTNRRIEIPVIRGPQLSRSGVPLVAGMIPAKVLLDHFVIPYHNPNTKKGYQRPPQQSRINELASDLRRGLTDLPTAILLNVRNSDLLNDGVITLTMMADPDAMIASAARAAVAKFYVVDGQHRVLALKKLRFEDDPLAALGIDGSGSRWDDFQVPFVSMLGASEEEEMRQFYIVNSKAKQVKTDLALILLRQLAENDPNLMNALTERARDWQVKAQEIVEALATASPPWRGRVRFAAMQKGETVMPSASMVTSMKPLLAEGFFKRLAQDNQVRVLDAYWRGLRHLMPAAFDEPNNFTIQKGVGVTAIHGVLPQVIEIVRSTGASVLEPESYEAVLREPLERLQGDNGSGDTVSGVDFWRSGEEGAAATFSSGAGRRVLIAKIETLLPAITPI